MANKVIFRTRVDQVSDTEIDKLGDVRFENGKRFKYVQYGANTTAGHVVKYENATAYAGNVVRPSTGTTEVVAGVAVATATANQYGWVQTGGHCTLAVSVTDTPAIGGGLGASATSGAFRRVEATNRDYGVLLTTTASTMQALLDISE
jgi:hypothetical protein